MTIITRFNFIRHGLECFFHKQNLCVHFVSGALKLVVGDGWQGWADEAPYNAIHVGAAAAHVPDALLQQLAPGGRMVVPVGPEGGAQSLAVIDKQMNGSITRQDTMSVMYVPLTSRERQLRKGW